VLAPVPRGARRLNWRRSTESCLRVWNRQQLAITNASNSIEEEG